MLVTTSRLECTANLSPAQKKVYDSMTTHRLFKQEKDLSHIPARCDAEADSEEGA